MGKSLRQANDYWQDQPDCYIKLLKISLSYSQTNPKKKDRPNLKSISINNHQTNVWEKSSYSLCTVNHTSITLCQPILSHSSSLTKMNETNEKGLPKVLDDAKSKRRA